MILFRLWTLILILGLILGLILCSPVYATDGDPLPSWQEGPTKSRIIDFVQAVSDWKSTDFVQPHSRVAVFDNDGTLWCEKPLYPQFVFAIDRAATVVKEKPELEDDLIFKAALSKDYDSLAKSGAKGIQRLVGFTHGGMSSVAFEEIVTAWIKTARHPRFEHPYNQCIYQPMIEVLKYFRENGFKTYIVSGGGRDFMRPWAEATYGISPEQVVGSSCKLEYRNGGVFRGTQIEFLNDGKDKPVGIVKQIGIRPIVAFGNSDGDFAMLEWTTGNRGKTLGAIVHHTDGEREYAYDKDSSVGRLDKALALSSERKWLIIDMKKDWKRIFPFQ